MTSKEAFEQWCANPIVPLIFELCDAGEYKNNTVQDRWKAWEAACEWQKEKDAELCDECREIIRNQDD